MFIRRCVVLRWMFLSPLALLLTVMNVLLLLRTVVDGDGWWQRWDESKNGSFSWKTSEARTSLLRGVKLCSNKQRVCFHVFNSTRGKNKAWLGPFSLSQERAKIAFSFLLHFFLFSLFSLIFFFSLADADGFHFFDSAFVGDVILHLCFFLGDVTAASDFVGDGDLKIAYGVPNVLLVHE